MKVIIVYSGEFLSVTIEMDPGDAPVWHGNSWHAGHRRDIPGCRINLAQYFCKPFMQTKELRGDTRQVEVFERHKNNPLFAQLLSENVYFGFREEGPSALTKLQRSAHYAREP